jgi:hypothetical protein
VVLLATVALAGPADERAAPDWVQVSTEARYVRHDHRTLGLVGGGGPPPPPGPAIAAELLSRTARPLGGLLVGGAAVALWHGLATPEPRSRWVRTRVRSRRRCCPR